MREETVVPRDAPTPALPQRGREEVGEAAGRMVMRIRDTSQAWG